MTKKDYVDSKSRKIIILLRLVSFEHLSYQQLSEEYLVSRSSIAADLSFIKELLAKDSLSLSFDNSGTYFNGNEIQAQKILKRMVTDQLKNGKSTDLVVSNTLLTKISNGFRKAIEEKKIEIPESYIQNIVISIALIVQRSKEGHYIQLEEKNQHGKFFLEFNKYPVVYELLKKLEDQGIYKFSSNEVQYLTYLIVGSGLNFFMKKENIPFSFRGKIRNLVQKISEGIQVDLTQDSRLEEDLLVHLYQLILRIEAQTTIVNPLINEIKQSYPALYGVTWFALNDFCKPYQISLSEDEIGFVTIHFQAAVERIKKMNKILFVCPNGVGTSSFVSAKIRRILPDINSIETASISKLRAMDLSEVDFIISTVDIPENRRPVVRISPMVTSRDMKKIMNYYIDLVINNEQKKLELREISKDTQKFISKNIFFDNFSEKEEAIRFLIDKQEFSSERIKNNFTHSVFEREVLQSTYLDNGFAIPHGNPEFVEETSISILILDNSIAWMNQKVDVIVLLMIREEDAKEVESVMKLVMHGIEDKEWFISKMLEAKK
ncbi:BglG family transcription antiterminator [Enterococcus songbeiensis]|uniref:BglG family transcription antiterminator n=1 Tax=Enterococcus songbeiensis TaxID=2559927 RepID=UPI0010F848AB|nr:PRD domain-containing protein [Enterococcus songbeiensis]